MKSIFYASIALATGFASANLVNLRVVGVVDPIQTIVSAVLTKDPQGSVTYLPSSNDSTILFSTCALEFNSSNFDIPQLIILRRKAFTPFAGAFKANGAAGSVLPAQSFTLVLSGPNNFHTLPLTWIPKKGKLVSWWGDPHFDFTIDDKTPTGQGNFLDSAIVTSPKCTVLCVCNII
jgi:hypothetical protein